LARVAKVHQFSSPMAKLLAGKHTNKIINAKCRAILSDALS